VRGCAVGCAVGERVVEIGSGVLDTQCGGGGGTSFPPTHRISIQRPLPLPLPLSFFLLREITQSPLPPIPVPAPFGPELVESALFPPPSRFSPLRRKTPGFTFSLPRTIISSCPSPLQLFAREQAFPVPTLSNLRPAPYLRIGERES